MKLSILSNKYIPLSTHISLAFLNYPSKEIWSGENRDLLDKYNDYEIAIISAITGSTLEPTIEILLEDKNDTL